jgi:hypothetical protein
MPFVMCNMKCTDSVVTEIMIVMMNLIVILITASIVIIVIVCGVNVGNLILC